MRVILTIGSTSTAMIDGISAAGASPAMMAETPAADAEIIEYGQPIGTGLTPVSPSGCPTPAVVTRAVRTLEQFETLILDAGTAAGTAAPTVSVGEQPGNDIRDEVAVPDASGVFERARELGTQFPDDELLIAESIPGGTTTAQGVFRALGESYDVSSSLQSNPVDLKRDVVETGLRASDLETGDLAGSPLQAIQAMGDPVLAATTGLVTGALETETSVRLAGGTQMVAVAALVRHAGRTEPIQLATTAFVAADETADLQAAATDLDLALQVTDPEFDQSEHVVFDRYRAGEAKEGAGMGGALALAEESDSPMATVREQIIECYEKVIQHGA